MRATDFKLALALILLVILISVPAIAEMAGEKINLNEYLEFSKAGSQSFTIFLPKDLRVSDFGFLVNATPVDYVDYPIAGSIGAPPHTQNYQTCNDYYWLSTQQKIDRGDGLCLFSDQTVNIDTDLSKVTSAKIISDGHITNDKLACMNIGNYRDYSFWESCRQRSNSYANFFVNKQCTTTQNTECTGGWKNVWVTTNPWYHCLFVAWDICGHYENACQGWSTWTTYSCTYGTRDSMTFSYYGSHQEVSIDKSALKSGQNLFSFSRPLEIPTSVDLENPTLRLFTDDVYPKNLKLDFGADGSYEYSSSGEARGRVEIKISAEAVNLFLEKCNADADGDCQVQVNVYSDSAGGLDIQSMSVASETEESSAAINPFALAGGGSQNSESNAKENNSSAGNILLPLALLSGAGALGYSYLSRRNLVSQNKNNYLNAGAAVDENENAKQNIFKQATGNGSMRKNIDNYLLAHKTGALYASGLLKASVATAFALGALATGMGAVPAGVALAAGGGAVYVAGGAIGMGVERAGKNESYNIPKENIFRQAFDIKDDSPVLKFLEPRSGKIFNKTREEKIGDALALGGVSASTFGVLQLAAGPAGVLAIPSLALGAGMNIGSVLAYKAAARKEAEIALKKNSSGSRENIFSSSHAVRNPNPLAMGETLSYPSDFGEAQKFALKSGATPGMIGINDKKTIGQKAQNFLVSHSEGLKKTSDGLGLVSLGLIAAALLAAPFTAGASLVLLAPAFATSVASSSIDIAVAGARGKAGIMDTDDKIRLGVSWLGFIPGGGKIAGQVGKQAARVAAKQTGKIGIKNMAAWDEFAKMSQTLGEAKFADPLAGQMKKLKFVARGILSRAKNEFTDLKSSTKYHIFGGAGIGEFAGKLGITLTNKSNTTAKKTVFFLSIIEKRAKEAKLSFRNAFKYVLMHERFIHGGLMEGKQIWKKTFGFFSDDVKNILVGPGYRNLEEKLAHVLTAMRYKGAHKLIMKTGAHKALLGSQTIPSQFEIVKSVIEEFKNLGKVNKDFIRMAKTLEDVAERYGKKGWPLPAALPLVAIGNKKSESSQAKSGVSTKIDSVKTSAKKLSSNLASKIQKKVLGFNSGVEKAKKAGSGFVDNVKNFISGKSPSSAPTTYYNRDRSDLSNPVVRRGSNSGSPKSSSSNISKPSGSSSGSSGGFLSSAKSFVSNVASGAKAIVSSGLSSAKSFVSNLFGKK